MTDDAPLFGFLRRKKAQWGGGKTLSQADVDEFNAVLAAWRSANAPEASPDAPQSAPRPSPVSDSTGATETRDGAVIAPTGASAWSLAWGARVSAEFRARVRWIGDQLGIGPSDLMACIAWETGRTFSAAVANRAGSGATGLIQFMPATALRFFYTRAQVDKMSEDERAARGRDCTAKLAAMTAEDQLNYVYRYFAPYKGRLHSLGDLYMAILWPKAVGEPDDYELWNARTRPTTYRQNAGLDANRDGSIIKAEVCGKLYAIRAEGLRPENAA